MQIGGDPDFSDSNQAKVRLEWNHMRRKCPLNNTTDFFRSFAQESVTITTLVLRDLSVNYK